jgi:hypothetical protein
MTQYFVQYEGGNRDGPFDDLYEAFRRACELIAANGPAMAIEINDGNSIVRERDEILPWCNSHPPPYSKKPITRDMD